MFLTVKQAAERLKVSQSLIYDLCARGILPHIHLDRSTKRGTIRIDPDELDGFLAAWRMEKPISSASPCSQPLNRQSPS